jgi:hypothetical protein
VGKTNTELREGQELKILISVPYAALCQKSAPIKRKELAIVKAAQSMVAGLIQAEDRLDRLF